LKKFVMALVLANICAISGAQTTMVSFCSIADCLLRDSTANWFANSPSNYLATYYGVTNYNYYHLDSNGNTVTNDPTGFGLTNAAGVNQLPFAVMSNGVPVFGVTNIPVYVNGRFVYTPAVNRVLQFAANLYDASTNSFFPDVFRPTFWVTHLNGYNNVYINGYQRVISVTDTNDLQLSAPIDVNDLQIGNSAVNYTNGVNVFNVPWIIGAKKGFPNFNNFSEENQIHVIRRIQLTRDANSVLATNQMYLLNLQSSIGVDFWNSYVSNFYDTATVVFQGRVDMGLTNDDGPNFSANEAAVLNAPNYVNGGLTYAGNGGIGYPGNGGLGYVYGFSTNTTFWSGSAVPSSPSPGSFITWSNTVSVLPYSVYRTSSASAVDTGGLPAPCLIPTNWFSPTASPYIPFAYETNGAGSLANYQLPQFGLQTTNRFQAYIIDSFGGINHIIDYVQISQENDFNLNTNIFINNPASVWSTNVSVAFGVSAGVSNQIADSIFGTSAAIDNQPWNTADARASASIFRSFLEGVTNQIQAGFMPICTAVNYTVFSANDPLVHYTAGDLTPSGLALPGRVAGLGVNFATLSTLGVGGLNPNYYPWGRTNIQNPVYTTGQQIFVTTNGFSFWLKDPLVYSSANWDFPTNPYSSFNWIGRVHRGTPWQTVYLKSTDVLNDFGLNNVAYNNQVINNGQLLWSAWTGDQNLYDSDNSAPVQDWHLASLLTSFFNTNLSGQLISVNDPDTNAFITALNGLTVWTNSSPDMFEPLLISSNSGQAAIIANAIESVRAARTNQSFGDVGDILAVPELSEQSPFLNWNNLTQQQTGISDEAYELIPSQLLSLLRMDSNGTMFLANGQVVANFTGWNGHTYIVQTSSDLKNWSNVSTNTPLNGFFSYFNFVPLNANRQFYRTLLLK